VEDIKMHTVVIQLDGKMLLGKIEGSMRTGNYNLED
jgi:hypothetical protein